MMMMDMAMAKIDDNDDGDDVHDGYDDDDMMMMMMMMVVVVVVVVTTTTTTTRRRGKEVELHLPLTFWRKRGCCLGVDDLNCIKRIC